MSKKQSVRSGRMPGAKGLYEEFENLLASFLLTMEPLKGSERADRKDRRKIVGILEGFASRHSVREPEIAAKSPRPTPHPSGRPVALIGCHDLFTKLSSFWYEFRVGLDPESTDGLEIEKLRTLLLKVLARRSALVPKLNGDVIVGIADWLPAGEKPFALLFDRS